MGRIVEEFPDLVLELSGPWDDKSYICNFKDRNLNNKYIHPGSLGSSMLEALQVGYEFAKDWAARRGAPTP